MSSIFFDWSGKIDQPIIEALSALKQEADALNIPFFVVGATARDLILKQGYGIEPSRLTRDIDLGIKVAGYRIPGTVYVTPLSLLSLSILSLEFHQ